MYEEQDTELAQRRKRHCAQECVGEIKSLSLKFRISNWVLTGLMKDLQIQKCKLAMMRTQIVKQTHIDHSF